MSCELPPPAPAPGVLADLCATHCWSNDIDDRSRLLLEWAADTIRQLVRDRIKAVARAEQTEAEAQTYANILYGPNQKGGAS